MSAKMLAPENLNNFYGTENWTRYSALFPFALLTDGALYVEENGAGWLIDLICSHQKGKVRQEPFQVWHLRLNPRFSEIEDGDTLKVKGLYRGPSEKYRYEVWGEDGNNNQIARQPLEMTDFPLDMWNFDFRLFLSWDDPEFCVILLPTEY